MFFTVIMQPKTNIYKHKKTTHKSFFLLLSEVKWNQTSLASEQLELEKLFLFALRGQCDWKGAPYIQTIFYLDISVIRKY